MSAWGKRILYLILAVFFGHGFLVAQTHKQLLKEHEEFRQLLAKTDSNKERTTILLSMSESFIEENATEALGLTSELLERVRKDEVALAKAYLLHGIAYYNLDRSNDASEFFNLADNQCKIANVEDEKFLADIDYYVARVLADQEQFYSAKSRMLLALEKSVRLKDEKLRTYVVSELAIYEEKLGNIESAITYHLEAYALDKKELDSSLLFVDVANLGRSYLLLNQHNKALNYFKEGLTYVVDSSRYSLRNLTNTYNNIGNTYIRINENDSAAIYLSRGMNLAEEFELISEETLLTINYGNMFKSLGDYEQADQYYIIAERLADENNNQVHKASVLRSRLSLLNISGSHQEALNLAYKLLDSSNFFLTPEKRLLVLISKSEAEINLGKHKDANATLLAYIQEEKKLFDETSSRRYEEFRTIYETDKKEDQLRIANLELDKKESDLKAQKAGRNGLLALVLLLLSALLFLWNSRKQWKKIKELEHKAEIQKLNEALATMSGRITDLVQKNLMPLEEINDELSVSITEREYEILESLLEGLTYKEIGHKHYISRHTVNYHLTNVYAKLQVKNRLQAINKLRKI